MRSIRGLIGSKERRSPCFSCLRSAMEVSAHCGLFPNTRAGRICQRQRAPASYLTNVTVVG